MNQILPSIDPFISIYQASIVHIFSIDIIYNDGYPVVIDGLQPQVLSSSIEDPMEKRPLKSC